MHRSCGFVVVAASLLFAQAAYSQFRERPEYGAHEVTALVDRVHDDLDRGYHVWHLSGGDKDRLNNAEKQLREFARKWERHKFDKGQLDDSISSVQHVLDNNRLEGPERDAIRDDVKRLRNMREAYDRHEIR